MVVSPLLFRAIALLYNRLWIAIAWGIPKNFLIAIGYTIYYVVVSLVANEGLVGFCWIIGVSYTGIFTEKFLSFFFFCVYQPLDVELRFWKESKLFKWTLIQYLLLSLYTCTERFSYNRVKELISRVRFLSFPLVNCFDERLFVRVHETLLVINYVTSITGSTWFQGGYVWNRSIIRLCE